MSAVNVQDDGAVTIEFMTHYEARALHGQTIKLEEFVERIPPKVLLGICRAIQHIRFATARKSGILSRTDLDVRDAFDSEKHLAKYYGLTLADHRSTDYFPEVYVSDGATLAAAISDQYPVPLEDEWRP